MRQSKFTETQIVSIHKRGRILMEWTHPSDFGMVAIM